MTFFIASSPKLKHTMARARTLYLQHFQSLVFSRVTELYRLLQSSLQSTVNQPINHLSINSQFPLKATVTTPIDCHPTNMNLHTIPNSLISSQSIAQSIVTKPIPTVEKVMKGRNVHLLDIDVHQKEEMSY